MKRWQAFAEGQGPYLEYNFLVILCNVNQSGWSKQTANLSGTNVPSFASPTRKLSSPGNQARGFFEPCQVTHQCWYLTLVSVALSNYELHCSPLDGLPLLDNSSLVHIILYETMWSKSSLSKETRQCMKGAEIELLRTLQFADKRPITRPMH